MNKQLESRIEALEMWIYRRMERISWTEKQANNEVLKTLGMKREILKEIRSRQMKYFVHIKRRNTLLKIILECKVGGLRVRGRQWFRWVDNIKRWTGYSLSECTIRARDRQCWRFIAANLRCGVGT